jgi:hypothetical protein
MKVEVLDATAVSSTSAAGPLPRHARRPSLLVSVGVHSADSTVASPQEFHGDLFFFDQTNSGFPALGEQSHGTAILELRRLSGLTWDQMARIFGVSRRSLHFWASGQGLNTSNEERLNRLLAAIRKIYRGAAVETRSALLHPLPDGRLPFDLLVSGRYEEVVRILGEGPGLHRRPAGGLSEIARDARRPFDPETLVSALPDKVHRDVGKARAARAIRFKGKT